MKKIFTLLILTIVITSFGLRAETLSLYDAIELGITNNLTIKSEEQNLAKANAQIQSSWSMVLPTITLNASYSKIDSYTTRQFLPLGSPSLFDYYQTKASINQLIFGMHALPALRAAGLAQKTATNILIAKKQETIFQIAKAYFDASKSAKLLELTKEGLDRTKSQHYLVQNMYKVGLVTKTDLLETEIRLKETETKLLSVQKLADLSKYQLLLLLDQNLDPNFDLETDIDIYLKKIPELSTENAKNKAFNSPQVQALSSSVDLLQENVNASSSPNWPQVFLFGNYGFTDPTQFKFTSASQDWNVGINAQWILFNGFSTAANVQVAQSEYNKLKYTLELTKKSTELSVINALLTLKISSYTIQNSKLSVEAARENLTIKKAQFKTGAATNEDVLNSQFLLDQAENNLLQAQYDFIVAIFNLDYILGTLDIENFRNK